MLNTCQRSNPVIGSSGYILWPGEITSRPSVRSSGLNVFTRLDEIMSAWRRYLPSSQNAAFSNNDVEMTSKIFIFIFIFFSKACIDVGESEAARCIRESIRRKSLESRRTCVSYIGVHMGATPRQHGRYRCLILPEND